MMEGTNSARAAVDRLLDMYDEYKTLTVKIAAAESVNRSKILKKAYRNRRIRF